MNRLVPPLSVVSVVSVMLAIAGCASSKTEVVAPTLARVDNAALGKMVQGVDSAKSKEKRDHAIDLLKEATVRDPSLWEARYNLGVLLAERERLGEAETELAKAAALAPNAEDVAVALAEVRRRRGKPGAAADGLQGFVRSFPEAISARTALVAALREDGRLDDAIAQAGEVLKRRPNDPAALAALALAHLDRGEDDTAELLSNESLKSEQKTAVAERTAGLIALERGDDAIAFQHFARASELDPKDTTARLNVGIVLLQAGIYPRAEKELRAVVDIEPDNDEATIALATAIRGQGKRENQKPYLEAEKLFKSVLSRSPHQLAATYDLAVLYSDFLVRPDAARPLYQRYVDDAPSKGKAREVAEKFLSQSKGTPKSDGAAPLH